MTDTKIKFGDVKLHHRFKHGKSIYVKVPDPLTGTCMGGMRTSSRGYSWKAFDDNKLVERIDRNV